MEVGKIARIDAGSGNSDGVSHLGSGGRKPVIGRGSAGGQRRPGGRKVGRAAILAGAGGRKGGPFRLLSALAAGVYFATLAAGHARRLLIDLRPQLQRPGGTEGQRQHSGTKAAEQGPGSKKAGQHEVKYSIPRERPGRANPICLSLIHI